MGKTLTQKIENLIRRILNHGALFSSISLNFLSPFLLCSRSPSSGLEQLISGSVYQRDPSPTLSTAHPICEIPSLVCNKKDIPKLISLKNIYQSFHKKTFRQLIHLNQNTSSRKNSIFKATNFDLKTKREIMREDLNVWGGSSLRDNYLYAVTDLFENQGFNMEYVRKINAREISLRKKYLSLLKKKPEYVSKEDIKRIKALRKELRLKIKDLEKQRTEQLQKKVKYKLVGYKSHLEGAQTPQYGLYNAREVLIARICKLNRLSRPPNYKEFLELSKKEKLSEKRKSDGKLSHLKQNLAYISSSMVYGSQEMSLKMVHKFERALLHHVRSSLLDFSSLNGLAFPGPLRADQYLELDHLPLVFQKFCFYFNPSAFDHRESFLGDNAVETWVKKRVNTDNQVFFVDLERNLSGSAEENPKEADEVSKKGAEEYQESLPSRSQRTHKKKGRPKTEVLFHFQHSDWPQLPHQKTVLILSKVDVVRNKILKTEERLELSNNSHLIKRAEDQTVYRISGFLPNTYHLTALSRDKIYQMSTADYLARVKKWNQQRFRVETAPLIPGVPLVITRFEVSLGEADSGEGLIVVDFDWTFELPKKETEPKKEKPVKKKIEKEEKTGKAKFNRLYQIYGQKNVKSSSKIKSESDSGILGNNKKNEEDMGISMDSEDEYDDPRLDIGSRLGVQTTPENQLSYLCRFLFFELVRKEDARLTESPKESQTRTISKEGLFEDSNVVLQGPLDQSQRVSFGPGKYVLTVWASSPEAFPQHQIDFKMTSSPKVQLTHLVQQNVVDFVGSYSPNKYFSLFHDKLLFNEDWATLSFHLQLFQKAEEPAADAKSKTTEEQDAPRNESKRRKRAHKDKAESARTSFDLGGFCDLTEDVHVILELYFRDRLLHRFGGRKSINTAAFCLHKRGPDRSESISKTNAENEAGEAKEGAEVQNELANNPLKEIETGFKFPTRMMSKMMGMEKSNRATEERKSGTNTSLKTNRTWSVGEWTLKAFVDPRENKGHYSDHKQNSKSNSYLPYILDPEAIKYYDLRRMGSFRDHVERQIEARKEPGGGTKAKPKGKRPVTEELIWHLRIVSSCEVRTTPDTQKEDSQRKLVENWELSEPGRRHVAAMLRELFLLSQKERLTSLTKQEKGKLRKLRKMEKEQIDKVMRRGAGDGAEESEMEMGEAKKPKTKAKSRAKAKAQEESEKTEELPKELTESTLKPLTSEASFSKPIRNLCRMWEGPNNLFVNSHRAKELRKPEYAKLVKKQARQNRLEAEQFKKDMQEAQENVFSERNRLYLQRKEFMMQNNQKMMQIFQKTESGMELRQEKEDAKGQPDTQQTPNNNLSYVSIEHKLQGESLLQDKAESAEVPNLDYLERIHEVHTQEIQLFTKLLKEMQITKEKQTLWNNLVDFLKLRTGQVADKKPGPKSKKAGKKKTLDRDSGKGSESNCTSLKLSQISKLNLSQGEVNRQTPWASCRKWSSTASRSCPWSSWLGPSRSSCPSSHSK